MVFFALYFDLLFATKTIVYEFFFIFKSSSTARLILDEKLYQIIASNQNQSVFFPQSENSDSE